MIQALITFMVVVLVVAFFYWAVTKIVASAGIDLPPIIMVIFQILCAAIILIALVNLIASALGVSLWSGLDSPRVR